MKSGSTLEIFNESNENIPLNKQAAVSILNAVSEHEHCSFAAVELVYVDESEIVRLNKTHLSRSYITDVITFRYDEDSSNEKIEGTIFCCAPRIREQATEFAESELNEFKRIFIHGLLHLTGYEDSSADEKKKMTELENFYLKLID